MINTMTETSARLTPRGGGSANHFHRMAASAAAATSTVTGGTSASIIGRPARSRAAVRPSAPETAPRRDPPHRSDHQNHGVRPAQVNSRDFPVDPRARERRMTVPGHVQVDKRDDDRGDY